MVRLTLLGFATTATRPHHGTDSLTQPPHASWIRDDCDRPMRPLRFSQSAASRFLDSRRLRPVTAYLSIIQPCLSSHASVMSSDPRSTGCPRCKEYNYLPRSRLILASADAGERQHCRARAAIAIGAVVAISRSVSIQWRRIDGRWHMAGSISRLPHQTCKCERAEIKRWSLASASRRPVPLRQCTGWRRWRMARARRTAPDPRDNRSLHGARPCTAPDAWDRERTRRPSIAAVRRSLPLPWPRGAGAWDGRCHN